MQWLSGRVLDLRPKGHGFKPLWRHCVLVLEQDIYPSLVLVLPRKGPYITERLLMGCKESNQTKKNTDSVVFNAVQVTALTIFKVTNYQSFWYFLIMFVSPGSVLFLMLVEFEKLWEKR